MNPLMALHEIQERIDDALASHPEGSSAQVWAAREAIEQAHRDGLIAEPPKWGGPRKAHVRIENKHITINLEAQP